MRGLSKNMKTVAFFGFKNGQLATVVISKMDNYEDAVNCDYYVNNPRNAKKQIQEWIKVAEP